MVQDLKNEFIFYTRSSPQGREVMINSFFKTQLHLGFVPSTSVLSDIDDPCSGLLGGPQPPQDDLVRFPE